MQHKPHPSRLDLVIGLLVAKREALCSADPQTVAAANERAAEQLKFESQMKAKAKAPAA